jgi:3-oxoacyl-[acyl-carrier-protein] synthase II
METKAIKASSRACAPPQGLLHEEHDRPPAGRRRAIEAAICALAIRDGFYPPTINNENPDPECDLDVVPNKGVQGPIRAAISTSLGFGGHNGVIALKAYN